MDSVSKELSWSNIFNTPLECGLRSAAILLAAFPRTYDLQRLVYYDYLTVHSGDVEGGPPSIHPPTPHRSGEILVRRSLVQQGLTLMMHRMVVEQVFTARGIEYSAGDYSVVFLDMLTTDYCSLLRDRAGWVVEYFHEMTDERLGNYIRSRWTCWGGEFINHSLFEDAAG